jgi:hypothetical protein
MKTTDDSRRESQNARHVEDVKPGAEATNAEGHTDMITRPYIGPVSMVVIRDLSDNELYAVPCKSGERLTEVLTSFAVPRLESDERVLQELRDSNELLERFFSPEFGYEFRLFEDMPLWESGIYTIRT